jgi:hypothetical protein
MQSAFVCNTSYDYLQALLIKQNIETRRSKNEFGMCTHFLGFRWLLA